MPLSNMKRIVSVPLSCSKFSSPCAIYPMTGQSKLSFFKSVISTKAIFDLIHVDTWGSYKIITYDGFRYFLTIVDDFCRAIWTYLLSIKLNAFLILQLFLSMVERQFSTKVKIIKTDNAFELESGKIQYNFFFKKESLTKLLVFTLHNKIE